MTFFPMTKIVNPTNFNWNVLIYMCTIIFSLVYFFVKGRRVYTGPVALIREDIAPPAAVEVVKT